MNTPNTPSNPTGPAQPPAEGNSTTQFPMQPGAAYYGPPPIDESDNYGPAAGQPPAPPYEPPVYGGPIVPPPGRAPSPLPWILGAVAALALVGLLVIFAANNRAPATVPPLPTASPTPAPPGDTPRASDTPFVIVITATPAPPEPTTPAPASATVPAPAPTTPAPAPTTPAPTISATVAADTATPLGLPTVTPVLTRTPIQATPTETPLAATPTPAAVVSSATPAPLNRPSPEPVGTKTTGGNLLPPAVGTAGTADAAPAAATEGYLTLQYFGQSTFYIAGGEGVRLLIDPAAPDYGYRLPFFDGLDALLISNWGNANTFTQVAPGSAANYAGLDPDGKFKPINAQVKTAAVRDVQSYHDRSNGKTLGENALWVVNIDGFQIVHLGDLGQSQLSDTQLAGLGRPDILMIPVGGGDTIDGRTALAIVQQLNPHLVIPMRYQTDRTPPGADLNAPDDFLGQQPATDAPNIVRLKKSDLPPDKPQVLFMSYGQ